MINFRCHNCQRLIQINVPYAKTIKTQADMIKQIRSEVCPNCHQKVYSEKTLRKELEQNL